MASIRNIKKSNKYLTVDYSDFSHEEYQSLLHSGSKVEPRKKASQNLLDYLCDKGGKKEITLWNNRHYKVPCDIRTFINTLLHEFMHHYDYYYLRLPDSVHCKGFESRIRDLRSKLQA